MICSLTLVEVVHSSTGYYKQSVCTVYSSAKLQFHCTTYSYGYRSGQSSVFRDCVSTFLGRNHRITVCFILCSETCMYNRTMYQGVLYCNPYVGMRPHTHNTTVHETCVNGHLYSETTCIKRLLRDVPKVSAQ